MLPSPILPLTDTAISDYRDHLSQYPGTDPVILAYLTRHINGLMCAEIEQVVTRLIRNRLSAGCKDEETENFFRSMRRSAVRNATFSEIKETLALFGNPYRDNFDKLVQESIGVGGIEKLGMAVGNRNQDAHENPPAVTFRELEEAFAVASTMVDAVRLTLETQ